MGKTLKQMAEELGVSKQRLYRFMKRENISESYQEGNTMYYDDTVEELIKSAFSSGETFREVNRDTPESHHETNQIHINDTDEALQKMTESYHETFRDTVSETMKHNEKVIEALQNSINLMQQQLTTYQQELERRDRQIEQLQASLEMERLHNHEISDKLAQLADQAQQLQLMQMQPPMLPVRDEEDQKKSFWKRIFRKHSK